LVLPCSLLDLARCRAGLRGFPAAPRRHRPSLAGEPESCGPSGLGSSTELSLLPWSNSTSSRGIRPAVRSRNHGLRRSPDPGADLPSTDPVTRKRAPSVHRPSVHSHTRRRVLRSRGTILEILFRPRGFTPPRRFPPLGGRGLVASRCRSWGSSRFWSRIPDPRPGKPDRGGRTESLLATHFHTPRRHPRLQPYHVTVAVAPLPLAASTARLLARRRCRRRP